LTWQQNDERQFIAGAADAEELGDWVGNPADWIRKREETWLIYSDQVPLWVKIGMLTILCSASELEEQGGKAQKAVKESRKHILGNTWQR